MEYRRLGQRSRYYMSVPGTALNLIRSIAEPLGYQLVVELSQHSIEIDLERPDNDKRAWDPSLYKSGNVFLSGYANPIKPRARANDNALEQHDTVDVDEGEATEVDPERDRHVSVISSSRFKTYMKQDLISSLLTPNEQWKMLAYAVGGLAVLVLINVVVSLSAAGAF